MTESLLDGMQVHLVDSIESAMELKRWASQTREVLGVDTESGGLSPWKTRLRLVQFGDLQTGWAVPWERWGGVAMEILNNYEGPLAMHNAPHDVKFLQVHAGWRPPWHRLHDTMTQAALVDPTRPKGLKPLASRLVDRRAVAGQKALDDGMRQQGWTWDTVPMDFAPYWAYGAMDPVLTAHLHHQLKPQVDAAYSAAYDLEMAVLRICTAMMVKGMLLDPAYIEAERVRLLAFTDQARAWLRENYGLTSVMSGGQLSRLLVGYGVEMTEFTDSGAPKMDKNALLLYQAVATHPAAKALIRYVLAVRHADKMVNTYLSNFVDLADADHVLHCSINPMAAITSRMSVSEPSLQNLPRDDKAIRGSFVPRAGRHLISCDADQIEMRIVAHLSRDPGLIQAFLDADTPGNPDFFSVVCRELYQDPTITKKDPRRQLTKNSMYARNYGAGIAKIAATAGVPYEQVALLNATFDARYPGLTRLIQRIGHETVSMSRAGKTPTVTTAMGRVLPGAQGREYAMINYLIQGSAAEALKIGMVNLDAAGLLDHMLLPIHDEILFEVPIDEVADVKHLIEETLTDRESYLVPMTWSADVMLERWAKA